MLYAETGASVLAMLPYGEHKRVGAYVVLPKAPGRQALRPCALRLVGLGFRIQTNFALPLLCRVRFASSKPGTLGSTPSRPQTLEPDS